jgi:hypothetical protein
MGSGGHTKVSILFDIIKLALVNQGGLNSVKNRQEKGITDDTKKSVLSLSLRWYDPDQVLKRVKCRCTFSARHSVGTPGDRCELFDSETIV